MMTACLNTDARHRNPERTFRTTIGKSAFGGIADKVCSMRAFQVLTDAVEKVRCQRALATRLGFCVPPVS
jgi:hypothetical protein